MRQDGLQRRRGRARAQRGQRAACADLRGWRPAAVRGLKTLACRRAGCVRAIANAPLSCFSRSQAASWGKRAKFAAMAVARTHSARQSSLPAWACLFTGRAWQRGRAHLALPSGRTCSGGALPAPTPAAAAARNAPARSPLTTGASLRHAATRLNTHLRRLSKQVRARLRAAAGACARAHGPSSARTGDGGRPAPRGS